MNCPNQEMSLGGKKVQFLLKCTYEEKMEYVQAGLNTTTNDSTVNIFAGMFVVTW